MQLEFTTTATCRPEIFRSTLLSFQQNLKGVDFNQSKLWLNVDPLPTGKDQNEVIAVASLFFKIVEANKPKTPNFTNAVKWCWSQPIGLYFFHLEDDWELRKPVQIQEYVNLLNSKTDISCASLRAYDFIDDRICLSPGLFRTEDARIMAKKLNPLHNPEKQLRVVDASNPMGNCHLGFKGMFHPKDRVVFDLGRDWLVKNQLKKDKGVFFTTWEKV